MTTTKKTQNKRRKLLKTSKLNKCKRLRPRLTFSGMIAPQRTSLMSCTKGLVHCPNYPAKRLSLAKANLELELLLRTHLLKQIHKILTKLSLLWSLTVINLIRPALLFQQGQDLQALLKSLLTPLKPISLLSKRHRKSRRQKELKT